MLIIALSVLFVIICFLLVVVVLLQTGKGGGISGAFGIGQAGQTIFGASGAGNVLTKATAVLGGAFMVVSLLLAMIEKSAGPSGGGKSILQEGLGMTPIAAPAGDAANPAGIGAPVTVTPAPDGGAPATNSGAPVTTPGTNPPGAATGTGTGTGN
ncbi:MAG: preprotein translocase subunit SecG [Candidatus Eisenbacteria bacterium]|nr:preprotein translocase subunit SecG [Candidatus Eisenbacteria bacterium]